MARVLHILCPLSLRNWRHAGGIEVSLIATTSPISEDDQSRQPPLRAIWGRSDVGQDDINNELSQLCGLAMQTPNGRQRSKPAGVDPNYPGRIARRLSPLRDYRPPKASEDAGATASEISFRPFRFRHSFFCWKATNRYLSGVALCRYSLSCRNDRASWSPGKSYWHGFGRACLSSGPTSLSIFLRSCLNLGLAQQAKNVSRTTRAQ